MSVSSQVDPGTCPYCRRPDVVVVRRLGEFELMVCRSCGNEWHPDHIQRLLETRVESDLTWRGLP